MITIKNKCLTVDISEKGAEIKRILGKNGTDFLWDGKNDAWDETAPILFPICGGLKDDTYIFEGKKYKIQKHGFIRDKIFSVVKTEKDYAELLFCSDDETKKIYPFDFAFYAIYKLEDNALHVSYKVENIGKKNMFFSVGAHEGYGCPDGLKHVSITFEKKENLDSFCVDGVLLANKTVRVLENSDTLFLKDEYFEIDSLIFKHINSRKLTLNYDNSTRRITVDFPEHDFLLLWSVPGAKFICVEPWCGMSDSVDTDQNLTTKEGIVLIESGKTRTLSHTITFDE